MKQWKKDGRIITPDRIILEEKIIPKTHGRVCFIGVDFYVQHYWELFPDSVDLMTVDKKPKQSKFGSNNHATTDCKHLPENSFDFVIAHGIAMFGTDNQKHLNECFDGIYKSLVKNGIFIYGWSQPNKTEPETDKFNRIEFASIGKECRASDYYDEDAQYNISKSDIMNMDVRFRFYGKEND